MFKEKKIYIYIYLYEAMFTQCLYNVYTTYTTFLQRLCVSHGLRPNIIKCYKSNTCLCKDCQVAKVVQNCY